MARESLPAEHKYVDPRLRFPWKGPFENWAKGWVARHHWRVRQQFGSYDDALQECAFCFSYCLDRYGHSVNEPKWMMALFKRTVASHWHEAANRDSRIRSVPVPDDAEQIDFNTGPLAILLQDASRDLQEFLHVVATAPASFLDMLFKDNDSEELLERRIKRLCGIQATQRILAELRDLLS